ncbi:MAG TPA: Ig-like domain-containing protein [Gemmatimonadaceae bacterium]|nr:Ig-like domain-containing protein [Gemmatimonadaceae bacterium]
MPYSSRRIRRPLLAALLLFAAGATGCGGDGPSGPGAPVPDHISLSQTTLTLEQQQSTQLLPVVVDKSGTPVRGSTVAYASANTSLVTVDGAGLVTSTGPTGSTVVTITSGFLHADLPVTVVTRAGAVEVSPAPAAVAQKETLQLTTTVKDVLGAPITGAALTFTSSDQSIATVSPTGLVTSVGPSGTATIHVASGAASTNVTVTVTQVPTSIDARSIFVLAQNTSQRIFATVLDAVGAPIANATPTFTSGDPSLVTVADDGTVRAGAATGATDVTVHAGAASLAVHVTVLATNHPAGLLDGTVATPSPWAVAVSRSGTTYVSSGSPATTLLRADLASRTLAPVLTSDVGVGAIVFDAAGATAYAVGGGGARGLLAVDVASNAVAWRVATQGNAFDVALSPDERTVYVTADDGLVYAVDATTHAVSRTFTIGGSSNTLAMAPDGRHLYVGHFEGSEVVEIDLTTNSIARRWHVYGLTRRMAVSLDGMELYIANKALHALTIIDLATGSTIIPFLTVSEVNPPWDVALSPDGTLLYVTVPEDRAVVVVDRVTRAVIGRITVPGDAYDVAFDANSKTALVTLPAAGAVAFIK